MKIVLDATASLPGVGTAGTGKGSVAADPLPT